MHHAAPGFNIRFIKAMRAVRLEGADEIAKAIGVSIPTACMLMSKSTPVVDGLTLIRICRVTKHSGIWLICDEGPPRRVYDDPDIRRLVEFLISLPEDQQPFAMDRCLAAIHATT